MAKLRAAPLGLIAALVVVGASSSALGQGDDEAPAFDLDAWKDKFEEHLSEKDDALAALSLQQGAKEAAGLDPRIRRKLATAMLRGLNQRREEGEDQLFLAVVRALPHLGEDGDKALRKAFSHVNVEKRVDVLAAAVEGFGSLGSPRNIKTLRGYLFHAEPKVVAGAARGFAHYRGAEERERKEIVDTLVKQYSAIYKNSIQTGSRDREPGQRLPRVDEERYKVVKADFDATLAALTGQKLVGSDAFYRWFNENRKRKWGPLEDD